MSIPSYKNPPANSSQISEFMRNASESEQEQVFKKVIEKSIEAQLKVIEQAERMQQHAEAGTRVQR